VAHAHFKDWLVRPDAAPGFRPMLDGRHYQAALIGEGVVDHRACVAAMAAAGYTGCINIEYEGNDYAPAEAVRRAVAYLRGVEPA
jgi:sugar phosphate isomerase/epimerase